jgi:hypothetical protein
MGACVVVLVSWGQAVAVQLSDVESARARSEQSLTTSLDTKSKYSRKLKELRTRKDSLVCVCRTLLRDTLELRAVAVPTCVVVRGPHCVPPTRPPTHPPHFRTTPVFIFPYGSRLHWRRSSSLRPRTCLQHVEYWRTTPVVWPAQRPCAPSVTEI